MRKVISLIMIFVFLSIPFCALAEEVTIDEILKNPNLTDYERNAVAKALQKTQGTFSIENVEDLQKWQVIGDAFAVTIEKVCKTLRVEVNEFLKSDVGILVAAVIIYKMVGRDILSIVLALGLAFTLTAAMLFSLLVFHKNKKIESVDKEGKTHIEYIPRFEWPSDVVRTTSFILHLVLWAIVMCIIGGVII